MPVFPPLSAFDAILHEHSYFAPSLAAAMAAADRLALDPENRHARYQARSALRFIRTHALPHMQYEEAVLFPRAMEKGAPEEVIALLVRDHEALRRVAEHLDAFDDAVPPSDGAPSGEEPSEGPPSETRPRDVSDSQVELLRRFVLLFEWHLGREEELMTTLAMEGVAPLPEHVDEQAPEG